MEPTEPQLGFLSSPTALIFIYIPDWFQITLGGDLVHTHPGPTHLPWSEVGSMGQGHWGLWNGQGRGDTPRQRVPLWGHPQILTRPLSITIFQT